MHHPLFVFRVVSICPPMGYMRSHAWTTSSFVLRYISGQLSDKTDKSAALLLTYSFLCPPFLSTPLVFLFYFLKFTLLELTILFEIDLPVMCTLNIKCCLKGLCLNGILTPFSFFQRLKKALLSFHLSFSVAHI